MRLIILLFLIIPTSLFAFDNPKVKINNFYNSPPTEINIKGINYGKFVSTSNPYKLKFILETFAFFNDDNEQLHDYNFEIEVKEGKISRIGDYKDICDYNREIFG